MGNVECDFVSESVRHQEAHRGWTKLQDVVLTDSERDCRTDWCGCSHNLVMQQRVMQQRQGHSDGCRTWSAMSLGLVRLRSYSWAAGRLAFSGVYFIGCRSAFLKINFYVLQQEMGLTSWGIGTTSSVHIWRRNQMRRVTRSSGTPVMYAWAVKSY